MRITNAASRLMNATPHINTNAMGNVTAKRRNVRDNLAWKVIEKLVFSCPPRMRHGGRDSSYRGAGGAVFSARSCWLAKRGLGRGMRLSLAAEGIFTARELQRGSEVLGIPCPVLDPDRRAQKSKRLANLILQKALI